MEIRIAGVVDESTVDGPGIRYTVFTQGCLHNCFGCHNPKTHPLNGGQALEIDTIISNIKKDPLISGVTISGGEPFLQPKEILELTIKSKEIGKNVIIYTGYTYEELVSLNNEFINEVLKSADYLVDGKFEINKKSYTLLFKGSSNQRIIDLKKTILDGKISEIDFSKY